MEIQEMNETHRESVVALSRVFYTSDALDHEVPMDIISHNIQSAINGDMPLKGYVFCEEGKVIGFAYVTCYYETEVGGICAQILDLYVDENYRGRGYATQFFNFIFEEYSHAKRFRLEVVKDNERAIRVYKRMGFKEISYGQMSIDRI